MASYTCIQTWPCLEHCKFSQSPTKWRHLYPLDLKKLSPLVYGHCCSFSASIECSLFRFSVVSWIWEPSREVTAISSIYIYVQQLQWSNQKQELQGPGDNCLIIPFFCFQPHWKLMKLVVKASADSNTWLLSPMALARRFRPLLWRLVDVVHIQHSINMCWKLCITGRVAFRNWVLQLSQRVFSWGRGENKDEPSTSEHNIPQERWQGVGLRTTVWVAFFSHQCC